MNTNKHICGIQHIRMSDLFLIPIIVIYIKMIGLKIACPDFLEIHCVLANEGCH